MFLNAMLQAGRDTGVGVVEGVGEDVDVGVGRHGSSRGHLRNAGVLRFALG